LREFNNKWIIYNKVVKGGTPSTKKVESFIITPLSLPTP